MGWYGDYNNSSEVMDETERGAKQQNCEVLDKKICSSYGALLYKAPDKRILIDYFIFNKGKYKPLCWVDGYGLYAKRIPQKWIKQALPYANEYLRQLYKMEHTKKEKCRRKCWN